MNKEFIPYEEALALKELGFIEPVIAYFKKEKYKDNPEWLLYPSGDPDIQIQYQKGLQNSYPELGLVSAPLYQQAFRWFREKHNIRVWTEWGSEYLCCAMIQYSSGMKECIDCCSNDEEAESACLDKLIKIVKDETNKD